MIKIRSFYKTIQAHWFIALISFIITAALINVLAFVLIKPYYSSSVDLISVSRSSDATTKNIKTYQSMIKTPVVLSPIHQQLVDRNDYQGSESELKKKITITADDDSQIFTVTATSSNPQTARFIANRTASILQHRGPQLADPSSLERLTIGKTAVYEHTFNRWIVITLSILSGLLMAILMVIWSDMASKKVTKRDLFESQDAHLIGSIKFGKHFKF